MRVISSSFERAVCSMACAVVFAVGMAACRGDSKVPWRDGGSGVRWRDLEVPRGAVGFTRMNARETGMRFQNDASEKILLGNRTLAQGGGVSLGDVDGDGRADIFLARTEGCSALYRNTGDWEFEDITTRARVGACDRHSSGSALADVDGDGDLDLVLLATTGPNAIFVNDGKARFTERRDLGLDTAGRGATTVTMADVSGDGHLAMFIANYKPYNVDDTIPPQQRAFNQMVREIGPKQFEIVPEHRQDYKLVMRPDMGGMRMTQRAQPDEFYTNDGTGRFTRVPMTSSRFRNANGTPIVEEFESFGLGAKFVDLNGDGAPDLYVANDFEDTDQLWYNDGKGNFQLADWRSQRQMSHSAMGFDVADVNGDGRPDLFEVDMMSNDPRRAKTQTPTHTSLPKKIGESELALQFQRNALFLNRGDGTFAEVSSAAGVSASGWSWGTVFMDVDLDGWQDMLIANGHLWDIMDADVLEGLQSRLNAVPWQRLRWEFPTLKLRNVAFRNRGNMTFEDASAAWRFGVDEDISHGLAYADLDGDGDLDVVINRLGAPALLMRNDAVASRISVQLVGDAPNTRAVGAKVTVYNGAVPIQVHEVVVGGLYLSHSDYTMSFAMGTSDSTQLMIEWHDGRRTEIQRVRKNRAYEISQRTAVRVTGTPADVPLAPLFNDATAQLGGHVHVEDPFDDWDRQYLLPNALSQAGPGMAWYDLDRDGADELLVGTGKGGHVRVFRNVRGTLVPESTRGPAATADLTSILGLTENGVTRVLAGVATWQFRREQDMIAQPAAVAFSAQGTALAAATRGVVGSHPSSTGPLALGDYDGDGALDLFVGSRAVPMQYPQPASSGLFRNVSGTFVLDTMNLAVLRDIGMVTSALFTDITGDGHADLVFTRDWGSIVLLINDGKGRLNRASAAWGLSALTSQWNGVASGDVNGDGRMDLVATSWGRNTGVQVDSASPLVMTYGVFGAGGEIEMLVGRPDARVRGLSPLNSYPRARMAVAGLVGRVSTFSAYADASVETVLGPALASSQRVEIRTLDHTVFVNRVNHFEATPLPAESQWAPSFAAAIADFDGDGAEDVFLAQNFFPTMIGTPRFDQGRGQLLQGNGTGGFRVVAGAESGIAVYGDQRSAAYSDFNGDGRLDLAVSQNGGATRLFANAGAVPGVRVRLRGSSRNPDAVGAQLRLVYADATMGPVREVQAGSGYLSQNGAVQVLGRRGTPTAVWIRWPSGREQRVPLGANQREVTVTAERAR